MKPAMAVNKWQSMDSDSDLEGGKRRIWLSIVVGLCAFLFYKYILYQYYLGDAFYYQRYYDAVSKMDLVSAILSQGDYLGSSELIYPVVAWVGSTAGIDRNTLMAAFDSVMYVALFSALLKYRCHPAFIVLCMANFYLVVLSTSAERLKFSYILFFIALSTSGRSRYAWIAAAPLAHLQSFITLGSIFIWTFFSKFSTRMKVGLSIGAIVGTTITLYVFYEAIITKLLIYASQEGLRNVVSGALILIVALFVIKNKMQVIFTMTPLLVITFLLGGGRMNMITFTVFLYMCLVERKTGHPGVLLVMLYFVVQTVLFIRSVLTFGTGFGY